jgi:putative endonuclease
MMSNRSSSTHLLRGAEAEQQAYDFLITQGLQPVCRNFHCKYGELDLVMTDADYLVVVEVRFRSSEAFGGAVASVTAKKRAKIIATTEYYLATHQVKSSVRFDVVAISALTGLNWIQNAFQT